MLELRSISKHYVGVPVLDRVSFRALPGEITGYLGVNGSGKSTTMKMIVGLLEPGSGKILFNGTPIDKDTLEYRRQFGYVPEEPYLYSQLSGLEYLTMVAQLRAIPSRIASTQIDGLLQLLSLYGDRQANISGYSKGMRQKLLLAAALMHNPSLLLLDEPFSGLDIGSALILKSLIVELAKRGKTILFSSHELETVEKISSRIVILHRGQIVADGSIEQLRSVTEVSSLEGIFSQFAMEQDADSMAAQIADVIRA